MTADIKVLEAVAEARRCLERDQWCAATTIEHETVRLLLNALTAQSALLDKAEVCRVPAANPSSEALRGEASPSSATTGRHGPFGYLVGAIDLDESHWRLEDDPMKENGYFSLAVFTDQDPFEHVAALRAASGSNE